MARKRDDQSRKQRDYKKRESDGKKKMNAKKCPHCGGFMKHKGSKGSAGMMYWKCRNKKCGRTVSLKKEIINPPIPLTYIKSV